MKKLVSFLIGLSVVTIILTVVLRLMLKPVLGIESHAIADFANLLLLLAIAISVNK